MRTQAIYVDTFGNVKLSALADDLAAALPELHFGERLLLRTGEGSKRKEVPLTWASTFGEVPEGAPLLTADSYGRVALSVHRGSAARTYGIAVDTPLEIARPAAPAPPPPPPRRSPPPRQPAPPLPPPRRPPAR